MPPLDWRGAQRWLSEQRDLQQWVFNLLRGRGVIVYDPTTGKWQGKDAQ
jgi:hypothetical protein